MYRDQYKTRVDTAPTALLKTTAFVNVTSRKKS